MKRTTRAFLILTAGIFLLLVGLLLARFTPGGHPVMHRITMFLIAPAMLVLQGIGRLGLWPFSEKADLPMACLLGGLALLTSFLYTIVLLAGVNMIRKLKRHRMLNKTLSVDDGFKIRMRKIIRNPWIMTPVLLVLAVFIGCVVWCRGRVPPPWLAKCLPKNALFERIRCVQTRADLARIIKAVSRFEERYGKLPIVQTLHDEQFSITLAHELHGVAPSHSPINPDGIDFSGIPAGLMQDGWNQDYHIMLDRDGDGTVSNAIEHVPLRIAVWSDGPNQEDEQGLGDDIRNW